MATYFSPYYAKGFLFAPAIVVCRFLLVQLKLFIIAYEISFLAEQQVLNRAFLVNKTQWSCLSRV
jgi:hypothetical protein